MLYNYILTGIRNLLKNKGINFINIFGLGLALSCCILEYSFVQFYNSMDTCHKNADRIFMVTTIANREGIERTWGDSPEPIGPYIQQVIPGLKRFTRIQTSPGVVRINENSFNEVFTFVDQDFFSMFSYPLMEGDENGLTNTTHAILSKETALKLFGRTDCLNENFDVSFSLRGDSATVLSFTVAGVADEFPKKASFGFSILTSYSQLKFLGVPSDDWKQTVKATFVEFEEKKIADQFKEARSRIVKLQNDAQADWPIKDLRLEPLLTLSNNTHQISNDIARGISPVTKVVMLVLAVLLLLLAIFNFINISLSNGAKRLKEIGYRKTAGASRIQLSFQFLTENFITALIGLIIGLLLANFILLPGFSAIGPAQLELDFVSDPFLYIFLTGILLITTLGGGGLPAFYISKFNSVEIFKGTVKFGSKNIFGRVVLTIQFFIAFATVAAGVVFVQNDVHQRMQDWGYEETGILVVPVANQNDFRALQNNLQQLPQFGLIAGSQHQLGVSSGNAAVEFESVKKMVVAFSVGFNYLEVLGIRLSDGRFFDESISTDSLESIVVNETFVKSLGLKDPLLQRIMVDSKMYTIIGVTKDFHYQNFFMEIQPVIFRVVNEANFRVLSVRSRINTSEGLQLIQQNWKSLFPHETFLGSRQDTVFDNYFSIIDAHATVILVTTIVSLLLASTGLYGVTSLRLSKKLRELSIRKVLGASGNELTFVLGREVMILLSIAIVLAAPLSFYYLSEILRAGYKYPVSISFLSWCYAIASMFLIALITIGRLLWKAIKVNPTALMRSE